MQANVHFETAVRGEELVALVALVILDAAVSLEVGGERAFNGERAEALRTLVGLLVGVYADVAHQVTGFLELLRAVRALVPSHAVDLQMEGRKCFIQRRTQHILFTVIWRQTYG